ncbi:TauD/TfdA family dioxygenase [Luedemannella flava]|uniref:TauD/TfdA family dioxygenase n=1 Tax=Luedemannella flava TaxID=349316 RepID=A0ABP4YI16_9ACTN
MALTSLALDVRRIGGRIGAEVAGVDLKSDLDDGLVAEINRALLEHKALVFRNQHLDDEQQIRFASRFGPLTSAHPTVPSVQEQPNILPVDGEEGVRANNWHTDVTFVQTPPKITTLRGITIPEHGGPTLIANTATAYADLPEPLRALADKLWAVHTNDYDYAQPQFDNDRMAEHRKVFTSRTWQTAHPVVRVHPETGERGLFIGGFAQRLVGLSTTESRDILRLLQAYVTRPENVFRQQWQVGDVVVFDNRITQHYAPDDYGTQPRRLNRVTVAGDVPVGLDGSRIISGDDASHYTPTAA